MMRALARAGVPFEDSHIAAAPAAVAGKTQLDAMVAYLQSLRVPKPAPVAEAKP
ncbi:hypothetical protein D3C83_132700 [compost metagenome]